MTSLAAAFNIAGGTVIGDLQRRDRHQEFLKFLRKIDKSIPSGLDGAVHSAGHCRFTRQCRPGEGSRPLMERDAGPPVSPEANDDAATDRYGDPAITAIFRAPAYLRVAVVNRSRSVLRHSLMMADDNTRGLLAQLRAAGGSVIGSLDRGAVVNAILALPPRQREALILRYHRGLEPARIAEHMGIRKGTVRSHLYRGLAALRAVLDRDQARCRTAGAPARENTVPRRHVSQVAGRQMRR